MYDRKVIIDRFKEIEDFCENIFHFEDPSMTIRQTGLGKYFKVYSCVQEVKGNTKINLDDPVHQKDLVLGLEYLDKKDAWLSLEPDEQAFLCKMEGARLHQENQMYEMDQMAKNLWSKTVETGFALYSLVPYLAEKSIIYLGESAMDSGIQPNQGISESTLRKIHLDSLSVDDMHGLINSRLSPEAYQYLLNHVHEKLVHSVNNTAQSSALNEMEGRLSGLLLENKKKREELVIKENELIAIKKELEKSGASGKPVEVNEFQEKLISQLKELGIEMNDRLVKGLAALSQSSRNDIQAMINYLKQKDLNEFHRQQRAMKLQQQRENYKGLQDACGFVCALGNTVGSRDLVRAGQIAHAGIQIHQATTELLTTSFVGVAIFSPYMAIGMAALKIFSLFQGGDNAQKILMKNLLNIARQIRALHQDVLKHFGRIDEKLGHLLNKLLEGFQHLEISLEVHVENKLSQIHGEIITLLKITQTGFEALLTQNLFDQLQHIEDIKRGIISPCFTQMKFNTRMGKLSRFISEESHSKLFNGLVYEHLLKDVQGNTQQIINICSQPSISIWQGLLGLLLKFAKENLKMEELDQVSPEKMFHPGLWQLAVSTYCDMQAVYMDQYSYDPRKINPGKFKKQSEQVLKVIGFFSTNMPLYDRLLELISGCNQSIESEFRGISASVVKYAQQSKLLFEIPEKVNKTKKNNTFHENFFTIENTNNLLKKAQKEIPAVFVNAQAIGLGYLEFQWYLPVRSRHHHSGYAVNKGEKAGLEVTFVTGNQRITLLLPYLSEKYYSHNLGDIYFHLLQQSKPVCSDKIINHVNAMIDKDKIKARVDTSLKIAKSLEQNPGYHQLLKLNHFLIAYLNFGGFSEELILEIKNYLLLDDIANQFASFAKNPYATMLPKAKLTSKNMLEKIQKLILAEIGEVKVSEIVAGIHQGILAIDMLEITSQLLPKTREYSHKPGQTKEEFFVLPSTSVFEEKSSPVFPSVKSKL